MLTCRKFKSQSASIKGICATVKLLGEVLQNQLSNVQIVFATTGLTLTFALFTLTFNLLMLVKVRDNKGIWVNLLSVIV
jgi:hypothetical protein